MLRALSAFLLVFCLLSLVVQQNTLASFFGLGCVALFALDMLAGRYLTGDRVPRTRVGTIL